MVEGERGRTGREVLSTPSFLEKGGGLGFHLIFRQPPFQIFDLHELLARCSRVSLFSFRGWFGKIFGRWEAEGEEALGLQPLFSFPLSLDESGASLEVHQTASSLLLPSLTRGQPSVSREGKKSLQRNAEAGVGLSLSTDPSERERREDASLICSQFSLERIQADRSRRIRTRKDVCSRSEQGTSRSPTSQSICEKDVGRGLNLAINEPSGPVASSNWSELSLLLP